MSEEYWRNKLEQFGVNYGYNVNSIKKILIDNRGYVTEIPEDEHVILLLSGGMDSVSLIDIIIKEWKCKVILLYFRRNSKNQEWEEKAVDFFYEFFKQKYPENILELLKMDLEIPSRINKDYLDRNRQKILGLPLRNSTMWDNTFTQAVFLSGKYKTTIRTVIVGSVEEDLTSPESGILSILSQTLHACFSMSLWYYQLLAPFIDGTLGKIFNKQYLLEYAKKYEIPLEKSRSCFGGNEEPCNECLACLNRNAAYIKFRKH